MVSNLSVLMPVLNGMPYLLETLESLRRQTFRNFELLVWDNGSTDGTLELLEEWIPSQLPGRIFRDDPRRLGDSLAELVLASQTDLCARMDADDISHPRRFEVQVEYMATNPKIDVLGSQLALIDPDGKDLGQFFTYPLTHIDIVCRMLSSNPIGHPSVVFRRSSVIEAGNYNRESLLEDYDLWLRMAPRFIFRNLPEALMDYRLQNESYTRKAERAGLLTERIHSTLANNAELVFGLSKSEVEQLVKRQIQNSFLVSKTILKHLSAMLVCPSSQILRNPYFLDSMISFTADTDTMSRLRFGLLKDGARGLARVARSKWLISGSK
jgi:glycosyltransferase involved in cell wall biosynthesis